MNADWERLAACNGHPNPGLWWPSLDDNDNHGTEAKAVCAQCPAIRPCLEQALERREEHGIRGGAGGDLLRWLRRAWLDGGDTWEQAFELHLRRLDGEHLVIDRNGPNACHGLAVTYARGCRCRPCSLAIGMRDLHLDGARDPSAVVVDIAIRQAGQVPAFLTRRTA